MAADAPLVEFAPAKVNLYLHVTGRRPDGYHLLDSLVTFGAAADRLEIRPAETLRLSVCGPFADHMPADPADNLIIRAAAALRTAFGIERGADLRLEKNLPVASGIGGGSSDAAAAIRGLCRLWMLDPAAPALAPLALALGADVPVCLQGRTVRMQGIGETILPLPALPPIGLVLVNPLVAVATPAVFNARRGDFSVAADWPADPLDMDGLVAALGRTRNDLQAPAVGLAPAIGAVLTRLAGTPGVRLARMSGSGATCFGICPSADTAARAAAEIRAAEPGWWVEAGTCA